MMIQDETLRSLYQTTGTERLQTLQMGLLQLEHGPSQSAVLEVLQQEIQTFKGDSHSLGLASITEIANAIADILQGIQHQTLTVTLTVSDHLYQGLQALGQLLHEAVTGESGGIDVDATLESLRAVVAAPNAPVPEAAAVGISTTVPFLADDELREIYGTTCEGRLRTLAAHLQTLEKGPVDGAVWESVRREVHSLKGDSRAVGLEAIAGVTEALEDIIKGVQGETLSFTPSVQEALYGGLQAIDLLVQEAVLAKPSGVDILQLLDRLLAVGAKTPPEAPEAPEAPPALLEPFPTEPSEAIQDPIITDAELREIYRTTSEERLQQLEAGLLHLEKNPQDSGRLAIMMREAHSLKGDARSTGVTAVEAVSHAIEDVLIGLQQGRVRLEAASDRLYEGLDAMDQLVREAVTGQPAGVQVMPLVEALREIAPAAPTLEAPPAPAEIVADGLPEAAPAEDTPAIETVRVHTRDLDALTAQSESLAVTRIQIAQTVTQTAQLTALWEEWQTQKHKPADADAPAYEERFETLLMGLKSAIQENSSKLEIVAEDLRDRVRRLQLLPLARLFQPLPRIVRDLAKQQSKTVNLQLAGEETLADKRLLEGIQDALLHLVRNAIDHGIETPEDRVTAGKPAAATLQVRASQTAISLVIDISDDGRGLDVEKIKRTALKRGLHTAAELEAMGTSQIQRLILAPGFSTRSFITEISGRGVGLDVVRTQVERLKGSLHIDSTPGQGCTFRLQLSTALSTANVVLVEVQGMTFALPVEFLQMTLLVTPEQVTTTEGQTMLTLGDEQVPVAELQEVLELTRSPIYARVATPGMPRGDRRPCVLLNAGEERAGFFVDRLIDQQEVVSKPLSPLLKRVRNVSGVTILGTGEVCMILNPPDMLKSLQQQPVAQVPAAAQTARTRTILLVEDSPTVRIQEKRLFEKAGYEVTTAINGLEGYTTLRQQRFDAVVSDVEMPFLDGFSLVAKIRQHPEYDDLPVILVTTLDSDADRKRGADAGASAYIIKGRFNQEALLGTLASLV